MDYSGYEWWVIKEKVLGGWDGRCERCGHVIVAPIVHHVTPVPNEDNFGDWYNMPKIRAFLGVGEEKEFMVVCKACHGWLHEWLRNPTNRYYKRKCDICAKEVLLGFIGNRWEAYETDGTTWHHCYFKKT